MRGGGCRNIFSSWRASHGSQRGNWIFGNLPRKGMYRVLLHPFSDLPCPSFPYLFGFPWPNGPGILVAPYRAILRYYRCDTPYRLALFKSPSGGGLTKMGSVTFWGPLDTSFLFAQVVVARWPQKTSVIGPQNLAFCEVLGSKCDKNKCGKYFGKFVKLVFAQNLPFVAETSKQC